MKDKKKKNLVLVLILFGILIIALSILLSFRNKDNDSNNNNDNDNTNSNIEEEIPVAVSTFDISNFEVSKSDTGKVKMSFELTNKNTNPITEKVLDINMYDGSNLAFTYNYLIEDLAVDESIYIEATAELEYMKLSRFEFVIDSSKVNITPNYIEE